MSVSVDVGSELAEGDFLCLVINGNGIDAGRTHATVPERETVFSSDDFFSRPRHLLDFARRRGGGRMPMIRRRRCCKAAVAFVLFW